MDVSTGPQEILDAANTLHDGAAWRPAGPDPGLRRRAVHLHHILMTAILGISAFYHDAAAALIRDGDIVAAAQEERFTRRKHDARYPRNAIDYVLAEAGLTMADVDHVAFYASRF